MFCTTCVGITAEYDKTDGQWKAPYVEGAMYCDCASPLHLLPESDTMVEWERQRLEHTLMKM